MYLSNYLLLHSCISKSRNNPLRNPNTSTRRIVHLRYCEFNYAGEVGGEGGGEKLSRYVSVSSMGGSYIIYGRNDVDMRSEVTSFAIDTTNTRDFARCELATREEQREFRILKALGVKTGRGGFVVREEGVRDVRK